MWLNTFQVQFRNQSLSPDVESRPRHTISSRRSGGSRGLKMCHTIVLPPPDFSVRRIHVGAIAMRGQDGACLRTTVHLRRFAPARAVRHSVMVRQSRLIGICRPLILLGLRQGTDGTFARLAFLPPVWDIPMNFKYQTLLHSFVRRNHNRFRGVRGPPERPALRNAPPTNRQNAGRMLQDVWFNHAYFDCSTSEAQRQ